MKGFYYYAMFFVAVLMIGSCSPLDDESGDNDNDNGGGVIEELGATLPDPGWQESEDGTLCTYRGETTNPYMPYVDYLAFALKDGVCTDATYNMMFNNEAEAKDFYDAMMGNVYDYSTRTVVFGMCEYKLDGARIYMRFLEQVSEDERPTVLQMRIMSEILWLPNNEFGPGTTLYDKYLKYESNAPWYIHWDGSKGRIFFIRIHTESQSISFGFTYSMEIDGEIGKAIITQDFGNAAYAREAYEEMLDDIKYNDNEDAILPVLTLNGNTVVQTYTFSMNGKRDDAYTLYVQNVDDFRTWIRAFIFDHAYKIINPRTWF